VCTIEAANAYLEEEFLPWWNKTLTVQPATAEDAHRPLGKEHDLAATLSHVEQRQVTNDYTVRWDGKFYQSTAATFGPACGRPRCVSSNAWMATIAVRFQDLYVRVRRCAQPHPRIAAAAPNESGQAAAPGRQAQSASPIG
jgi:hypothetical protein